MTKHPLAHIINVNPPPQIDEYWQALGRFVTVFARTETLLQQALWQLANTPPPIARAVFSGTRSDTAMSFIRRLAESLNLSSVQREEVEFVFAQLAAITKIRNDILHYGPMKWSEDYSFAKISNRTVALTPEKHLREINISPHDLRLMTVDLIKIEMHLFRLFLMPNAPENDFVTSVLKAPWLYGPAATKSKTTRSRKDS